MNKIPLFLIIVISGLMFSCAGSNNKMSHKQASSSDYLASEKGNSGSGQKGKQTYKSNKYHSSTGNYDKVHDPTVRNVDGNAGKKLKRREQKRKMAYTKYLIYLNQQNKYKSSKINTGKFNFY
ncbi:MAG: hypothetical protein ACK40G_01030 [Cytophagaceae bacterium]